MPERSTDIPRLFINRFTVDYAAPFQRHLNRLEVEIGKEDYRGLKQVELLAEAPPQSALDAMEELTERLLHTTQNNYNRELLQRLAIRVYLDHADYTVYYRSPSRTLRFIPVWRQQVLRRFFNTVPRGDDGWHSAASGLPGFEVRYLPDRCGGVLLLRRARVDDDSLPLLTATHGPYDPQTLEVALYLLRTGRAMGALINLGFSGREPLTDENLEKLKRWGVPLNPSNIDVIYPYADAAGHPYAYKLEENLSRYAALLERPFPSLLIDIHGCVGTSAEDHRLIVGLGGLPPFQKLADLGAVERQGKVLQLRPRATFARGLALLRYLSEEIRTQLCVTPRDCYNLRLLDDMHLSGRLIDPREEVESLLPGEERSYLPDEDLRWLPGAGGNALQRMQARRLRTDALCLHVEIPTAVRRRVAVKLRELEITDSLASSGL